MHAPSVSSLELLRQELRRVLREGESTPPHRLRTGTRLVGFEGVPGADGEPLWTDIDRAVVALESLDDRAGLEAAWPVLRPLAVEVPGGSP